jgi:hypothetical protein
MGWAGHVARRGMEGVYRIFVGKPDIKRSLGKPRHRWRENSKMDRQEIGWGHGLD